MTLMKIITIYLYVTLTLYFVVCHGLTEEDEMKRRASSASSGSLKQTLKYKNYVHIENKSIWQS